MITALTDTKVVATRAGTPTTARDTFKLLSVSPQLKHRSAKELCTTLHFLHSFAIVRIYICLKKNQQIQ